MKKPSLIEDFLNRNVIVERDKETVQGKLVYFKPSTKGREHSPHILILKIEGKMIVLRNWDLIKLM